jgi:hypothetical protein
MGKPVAADAKDNRLKKSRRVIWNLFIVDYLT